MLPSASSPQTLPLVPGLLPVGATAISANLCRSPISPSSDGSSMVVAAQDLPAGLESAPLSGRLDVGKIFCDLRPGRRQVKVTVVGGRLGAAGEEVERDTWMMHVHWARDCHMQNLQVALHHEGLVFRTSRSVSRGEELFVWFVEEVAKELGIPFLTPLNIQGQQRYVCHECGRVFTEPNPLKVHLAFACPRTHPVSHLHPALPPRHATPIIQRPPTPPAAILPWRPAALYPVRSSSSLGHHHPTFRNYPGEAAVAGWLNGASAVRPDWLPVHPTMLSSNGHLPSLSPADVKSRRGHQCIYCGKLYSRKYGLKIHIRTHTGYKPLECRVCRRPFGDPSNLNKHVRLHAQGHTPYRCHQCGKVLVRRRDLERHLKSRHPTEANARDNGSTAALPPGETIDKNERIVKG